MTTEKQAPAPNRRLLYLSSELSFNLFASGGRVVGEKFAQEILARQHDICVLLIRPCRCRLPHPVSSFPCDLLPSQRLSLSPSVTTSTLSDATCRRACSMPLFGPAPQACISLTYIQFISMNDIHVISRDICLYPNEISTQDILGISKAFILPISRDIHITYPFQIS